MSVVRRLFSVLQKWGQPWHGLTERGLLTLPDTTTKSWVRARLHGLASVVRLTSPPSVSNDSADTAAGREWRNYALVTGYNKMFYGKELGENSVIYAAGLGNAYRVQILSYTANTTSGGGSLSCTVRIWPLTFQAAVGGYRDVAVSLTNIGQPIDIVDGSSLASTVPIKLHVESQSETGARSLVKLYAAAPDINSYANTLDARQRAPIGFLEMVLTGSTLGTIGVAFTVQTSRAYTGVSVDTVSSSTSAPVMFCSGQNQIVCTPREYDSTREETYIMSGVYEAETLKMCSIVITNHAETSISCSTSGSRDDYEEHTVSVHILYGGATVYSMNQTGTQMRTQPPADPACSAGALGVGAEITYGGSLFIQGTSDSYPGGVSLVPEVDVPSVGPSGIAYGILTGLGKVFVPVVGKRGAPPTGTVEGGRISSLFHSLPAPEDGYSCLLVTYLGPATFSVVHQRDRVVFNPLGIIHRGQWITPSMVTLERPEDAFIFKAANNPVKSEFTFKQSGIKATTSTTGTGNLTITNSAGFDNFSDHFTSGVPVPYMIVAPISGSSGDGPNDQDYEIGIGTWSSSGTIIRPASAKIKRNGSGWYYYAAPLDLPGPSATLYSVDNDYIGYV